MTASAFGTAEGARAQYGVQCALTTALGMALAGVVSIGLLELGWTPASVVFFRCSVAAVALAPFAARSLRRRRVSLVQHWRLVIAYGVFAVAGCQLSYVAALQHLQVSVALLVVYFAPVAVIGYLWLRDRDRPGRNTAVGGVVAIVGLVLLLDLTSGARLSGIGIVYALTAMGCTAVYFVLNASTSHDLPPVALVSSGLGVGSVAIAFTAAVGLLPWSSPLAAADLGGLAVPSWTLVLLNGTVFTALPYLTAVQAGRHLGSRLASFLSMSEVPAAVVLAWVLLGQTPAAIQLAGGLVMLVGVIIIKLDTSGAPEPEPSPSTEERSMS